MKINDSKENNLVSKKIQEYPEPVQNIANEIRSLIHEVARTEKLGPVQESLKWGEPSLSTGKGTPIRFDWKSKNPENFYLFFNCQTILVETFTAIYGDFLKTEGRRAVILNLREKFPKKIIRDCISMAVRYHQIKHLRLLGA